MKALREVVEAQGADLHIQLPESYRGKRLEVLVVELDAADTDAATGWPSGFFATTSGCMADAPLVREDQGDYEDRDQVK